MATFVAIRRDNVDSPDPLGPLGDSTHAPRLAELGMEQFALPDLPSERAERAAASPSCTRPVPDGAVPGFTRLDHLGVYVVQADDAGLLRDGIACLSDEYEIAPDVRLSLPTRVHQSVETVDASVAAAARGWPSDSGIAEARAAGNRGAGVVVGVLDTGCDADHAEFDDRRVEFARIPFFSRRPVRLVRGFDTDGHGTHVCGIAAGREGGIAPDVHLLVASVLDSETDATSLDRVVRGLDWMLRRRAMPELRDLPFVLNLSLGFQPSAFDTAASAAILRVVRGLMQKLTASWILPVVAIGNDGPGTVRMPGAFPEALAIGAVDVNRNPARFSGGGPAPDDVGRTTPDLVGPGVDITSSYERDHNATSWFAIDSGTSMAAPYVAGVAALVAAATGKRGVELRAHLLDTAVALPHPPDRVGRGLARVLVP